MIKGSVRLLTKSTRSEELITISKRGKGQYIGWVSLLRGDACETVQAMENTTVVSISGETFIKACLEETKFLEYFNTTTSVHESWKVLSKNLERSAYKPNNSDELLLTQTSNVAVDILDNMTHDAEREGVNFYLSSNGTDRQIGEEVNGKERPNTNLGYRIPIRVISIPKGWVGEESESVEESRRKESTQEAKQKEELKVSSKDLEQLGIISNEDFKDRDKYPALRGRGMVGEGLAILEMVCRQQKLPMRKELCKKLLKDQDQRGKTISIEGIGALCEGLGCQTQIGAVKPEHLNSVDYPAVEIAGGNSRVIWEARNGELIYSDPKKGLKKQKINDIEGESTIKLLLIKRKVDAGEDKFGWSWFIPLVKKYKWALALVFVATLLAQLMGLAIPLLLQQIIDKVLSQGNVSTLNVLGSTMIILALFSGLLTALRQFIFVDTTDRMDLTLGSAVIDRLLALPLRYFEKRPVGELSQRLGELNSIRSFLTGTALISVMNLLFAFMYLIVMVIYSPILTAVALSTFPIYLILVLIISPIYKQMIRKRAVAAAKTQSHLIEILTGIQAVKAQNSQLTARWKWQDRYKKW